MENIYDADPRFARHFEQALRAHALYKRDRDYIVKDGEIIIVDEFTGRQMPGRRWSEGLHQAIEAKEGLRVQRESVTMATITFQNYFRLYDKLAGMTGTAMTEARGVPQDLPARGRRDPDPPDRWSARTTPTSSTSTREAKFNAVIDEIEELQAEGAARSSWAPCRSRSRSGSATCSTARDQARGPERQVPREGIGDRGPGGPDRRGHDRHEHGRPRDGHPARRQPGGPRLELLHRQGLEPGRGRQGHLRRGPRRGEDDHRRGT